MRNAAREKRLLPLSYQKLVIPFNFELINNAGKLTIIMIQLPILVQSHSRLIS